MADYYPPPLPAGATVWAYLRDSGGPAQENSVAQQEAEIRAYCQRYKLTLTFVFKDIAKSGGSVISRDDFERMIDQTETIRPDGLLIWNYARFSRDENDSMFYKALLRKRGIVIHSLTDPIPNDGFGLVIESLIDFSNAEKRRQNSRDVKRGLTALVKMGFAPGKPPKGYKRVQIEIGVKRDGTPRRVSKWIPDPAAWDRVITAWKLRAEGKSYQEIQQATGLYKSINCWNTFFRNKNYLGSYTYGGVEYPDHHQPAITWEIWEAVQKIRESDPRTKNNPRHPRRVGTPSLLTGYAYCLDCGSMMTHTPGHKGKPWRCYICGKKDRQGAKACPSRRVGEKPAENAILNAVINQVLSPAYLEAVLEHTRAAFGNTAEIEKQIALAKQKLDDLELAIRRVFDSIERTGSESAYERLKQRERERAQVKAEINHLEAMLAAAKVEITPEAMQIVLDEWRKQFTQARQSNDVRLIRTWLYRFVSRIEIGYNRAKIYYTYPMIDFSPSGDTSRDIAIFRGGTK
ncbi:MAG: recombinase family protein [Chloroflexota bacterium]